MKTKAILPGILSLLLLACSQDSGEPAEVVATTDTTPVEAANNAPETMGPESADAAETEYSTLATAVRTKLTPELQAMLELPADAPESVVRGEDLYAHYCQYCHDAGIEKGGSVRLEQRYKNIEQAVLAVRTDLVPEQIRTLVRQNTPGMPPYRLTELTEQDLDDVIAYLTRNNP